MSLSELDSSVQSQSLMSTRARLFQFGIPGNKEPFVSSEFRQRVPRVACC